MAESPQGAQPVASTSAPAADAWRALGRDSPAGKALFRLYNGDFNGKQAGGAYHDRNRQRHQARVAAGSLPAPPPQSPPVIERPQVNYPKFGRVKHTKEAPVVSVPRRKAAQQIFAELEEERQRVASYRPVPTGPLLDDKEKDRCAMLMRYRGRPPEITNEERVAKGMARSQPHPHSEKEELSRLFQQVVGEIEERKQFLADLQAAGGLKRETQHQVTYEIKQRVQDLEKLDRMIANSDQGRQNSR